MTFHLYCAGKTLCLNLVQQRSSPVQSQWGTRSALKTVPQLVWNFITDFNNISWSLCLFYWYWCHIFYLVLICGNFYTSFRRDFSLAKCGKRHRSPTYCNGIDRSWFFCTCLGGTGARRSYGTCCKGDPLDTAPNWIQNLRCSGYSHSLRCCTWRSEVVFWSLSYGEHRYNFLNRVSLSCMGTSMTCIWTYRR